MGLEGVKGEGGVDGGDGGLVVLDERARAGGGTFSNLLDPFKSTKREDAISDVGELFGAILSKSDCIGKLGKLGGGGRQVGRIRKIIIPAGA